MNGLSFSILIVTVSLHFCLQSNGMIEKTSLIFKSLPYETRIYESASTDVEITKFEAYYLPINSNITKIEYRLAPFHDYQYFKINSSSGKISTNRTIDRRIGEKYNITVLALSSNYNNRIINASLPLSIIVSAYNKFGPQFTCDKYSALVHISSPIGSKILKVEATDRDQVDYNSRIFYSLITNSKSYFPFKIDSSSGELMITDRIPANQRLYSIKIKAYNTGSPIRYNITIVQLEIDTSLSVPIIASIFVQQTTANICWSMPFNESVNGYLIKYKGEYEKKPTTINITTSNNKFECLDLYDIEPNNNYSLQIHAWNKQGIGKGTDVQHFISRKTCDCDENSVCKFNANGVCVCPQGILGSKCDKNKFCPCSNNGTCLNNSDTNPKCICKHGFEGNLCQYKVKCKYEMTVSSKGLFVWNSTEYGNSVGIECHNNKNTYATRLCLLMANGSAVWDNINDSYCNEQIETYETTATTLGIKTLDFKYFMRSGKTKSNAEIAFKTIDDILSINESDSYYESNQKIPSIVNQILSTVPLSFGEEFVVHRRNIAFKVIDVSNANRGEGISFQPQFQKLLNFSRPILPSIKLPSEAFIKALKQTDLNEVRVQIVAYSSQKLFKQTQNEFVQNEMPVIEATIGNSTISQLNEPVIIVVQCFHCNLTNYPSTKCVFWDEDHRNWSTEGIKTEINVRNKSIICHSSHLTAFSVLFDFTPYENTMETVILSTITYIGCYLSISGLFLTIITYSIFRCLNRDNSGKILLHLCISLIALNISFISGSQKSIFGFNDTCALVAVLIHYFVLTSLSWMCVEAIHIYQLLIHVFATAETHYMLKRTTIAWGLPFIWVFITVFIRHDAYYNRNDYCMISPKFADVYYISYLMPASVLIVVNFAVFVLATKVLFTPRMAATTSKRSQRHSSVSISQIRGAFTVMTLLGVSWIFGALAIGEMKHIFQYLFCLANSLQGFFIFLIRCVQYPEARNAWIQLIKTGTFKKHRGQPQEVKGSLLVNSNRLSAEQREQSKETDSTFSMTANRNSDSSAKFDKLSKPFLDSDNDSSVHHFTTYDSIRVSTSCQTDANT